MDKKLDVFSAYRPLDDINIKKSEKDKKSYYIEGIATSEHVDSSGEIILQSGLDWSYALKSGHFNLDHKNDPKYILGNPEEIQHISMKGVPATVIKGILYAEKPLVKDLMENISAMKSANARRKLGFSIEGQVIARDPRNPKIITKAKVLNISLTHNPCNTEATVELVKNILNNIDNIEKKYDYKESRCERSDGKKGKYILTMTDSSGKQHEFCHTSRESMMSQIAAIESNSSSKGYKMKKEYEEGQVDHEYADLHMTLHHAILIEEYGNKLLSLLKMLPENIDLAEWIQSKLTKAADDLHVAYHHLEIDAKEKMEIMAESYHKAKVTEDDEEVKPEEFAEDDDYQTNDKPYGVKVIEKDEEGSLAPITEESLEGKKEDEDEEDNDDSIDELASEDYELSSAEMKSLVQRIIQEYGKELSDDKIMALLHKLLNK